MACFGPRACSGDFYAPERRAWSGSRSRSWRAERGRRPGGSGRRTRRPAIPGSTRSFGRLARRRWASSSRWCRHGQQYGFVSLCAFSSKCGMSSYEIRGRILLRIWPLGRLSTFTLWFVTWCTNLNSFLQMIHSSFYWFWLYKILGPCILLSYARKLSTLKYIG
ncbi:hypothetical protein ACHAWF_017780 [Thalassiosira exigua]